MVLYLSVPERVTASTSRRTSCTARGLARPYIVRFVVRSCCEVLRCCVHRCRDTQALTRFLHRLTGHVLAAVAAGSDNMWWQQPPWVWRTLSVIAARPYAPLFRVCGLCSRYGTASLWWTRTMQQYGRGSLLCSTATATALQRSNNNHLGSSHRPQQSMACTRSRSRAVQQRTSAHLASVRRRMIHTDTLTAVTPRHHRCSHFALLLHEHVMRRLRVSLHRHALRRQRRAGRRLAQLRAERRRVQTATDADGQTRLVGLSGAVSYVGAGRASGVGTHSATAGCSFHRGPPPATDFVGLKSATYVSVAQRLREASRHNTWLQRRWVSNCAVCKQWTMTQCWCMREFCCRGSANT